MVQFSVRGDHIHLEVLGCSRWLGFKRTLDFPVRSIVRATTSAGLPRLRWNDLRLPGTSIPGLLIVGTYWMGSPRHWAFIDATKWSKEVLNLELEGEDYKEVIVEVENAQAAMRQIPGRG